jgi:hypothetical protein
VYRCPVRRHHPEVWALRASVFQKALESEAKACLAYIGAESVVEVSDPALN